MKRSIRRNALLMGILLAFSVSGTWAHTLKGPLAKPKTARIKWKITCYPPATQMVVRLSQTKKTKTFKVELDVTGGSEALELESIPLKDKWTPYFSIHGGAGDYFLELSKVGSNTQGAVTYVVDNHCETDSGVHTNQSNPSRVY